MALVYIDLFSDDAQGLTRTDNNTIAAGASNTLAIRVSHDGDNWSGLDGYARFEYQAAVYDVPISEEGIAVVPWEVCKYPAFIVSLWGDDGNGGTLTTERVTIKVERSLDVEGAEPIPATPSLVGRFAGLVEQCMAVSKGLTIVKVYASVEDMQADTTGEVTAGQFVSIQTGTDTAADDGKIYLLTDANEWLFVGHIGKDGEDGADGQPGADGAAATIYVSETVTGEPGTQARVENVGSATDARFKFTIPRGADGGGSIEYPVTIEQGGTGATDAATALTNIGAAAAAHEHNAADIASGALPVENGGTGATTAADALANLGALAAEKFGKLLWSGKLANGGSVTIEGISQYRLIAGRGDNNASYFFGFSPDSSDFRFVGTHTTSTPNMFLNGGMLLVDKNEKCTLTGITVRNINNSTYATGNLTALYGLL